MNFQPLSMYLGLAWLAISQPSFGAENNTLATLRGFITDTATGSPAPCTVTITDAQGKTITESDSFKGGFRSSGRFEKNLLPGRTKIRITRGFETPAEERTVDLNAGETKEIRLTLRRAVDLRARGWYAGDSHVHMIHGERTIPVDFDFVALTAQAEDLQYLSLSHAWQIDHPTPESLSAELDRRSTPSTVLTWNIEAPKNYYLGDAGRCLGHCWNLGLRGRTADGLDIIPLLLEASAWDYESDKPPIANFEIQRLIHDQDGAVFYTHPARWWMGAWGGQGGYPKKEQMRVSNMAVELPLDVLVGPTFDGIDLITGPGEFEANVLAFEIWSLLLNHGYRLAATASSDSCFDRPGGGIPGVVRTYTYVEQGFSLPAITKATAAGKTFVTSGPLLLASVNQQPPGSSFPAQNQSYDLTIEGWASGNDSKGLTRLEVWRNGRLHQEFALPPGSLTCHTNVVIRELGDAWYCVKLFGSDPRRQRAISSAFYFETKSYQPPSPVQAQVQARITDAVTGKPLAGTLTEMTYFGTRARQGKVHDLPQEGGRVQIPGNVRLRAEVPGYTAVTLSPFFNYPALVDLITQMQDKELVDWRTYERIRELLGRVPLHFKLTPLQPGNQ